MRNVKCPVTFNSIWPLLKLPFLTAGGGTMEGTIMAQAGCVFSTAGNTLVTTLNGRALGLNVSVTIVDTVITIPAP